MCQFLKEILQFALFSHVTYKNCIEKNVHLLMAFPKGTIWQIIMIDKSLHSFSVVLA